MLPISAAPARAERTCRAAWRAEGRPLFGASRTEGSGTAATGRPLFANRSRGNLARTRCAEAAETGRSRHKLAPALTRSHRVLTQQPGSRSWRRRRRGDAARRRLLVPRRTDPRFGVDADTYVRLAPIVAEPEVPLDRTLAAIEARRGEVAAPPPVHAAATSRERAGRRNPVGQKEGLPQERQPQRFEEEKGHRAQYTR